MKGLGRGLIVFVFVFVFAICCFTQTALAQKEEEQKKDKHDSSYNLDEITVSGKRAAEPVTSPYAVPESSKLATEIITKEEIEEIHPQTVYDILEYVPGMEVTFQGREHIDFANMRGMGKFGIIIDGVYVQSADRFLSSFPVEAIESIRVVRDASALLLGPLTNFGAGSGSSNQGFIIIKTKRASKLEGGFTTSYGSFHTDKEHIYQGDKVKDFDYRVAYTHRNSLGKTSWYNAYRDQSVLFRGGYAKEGAVNADIFYYTSRGMREIARGEIGDGTKSDGSLGSAKWRFNPLQTDMVALNLSKAWNAVQTTTFSASYTSVLLNKEANTFPKESALTSADQDIHGYQLDLRHTAQFKNNLIKVGGQMLSSTSPTGLAPTTGQRSEEDMYSFFVWDEYKIYGDKVKIDGGIRVDKKYFGNSPVTGTPQHEWAKETYTYAAGIAYNPTPTYTLTGRFAYSENTPASYQVDSTTRTALPAEKRFRYEGGVLANFHPALNPWVTLFYYDTKNEKASAGSYIDPVTGEEIDLVTNADVKTKGVEVGFSGQLMKSLSYRLNYSYVNSDDHDTNISMVHHMASARISHTYKGFDTNLMLKYVGPKKQSVTGKGKKSKYEMGDYTRIDANVGYNFKVFQRATKLMVYGQNLGDVHYTTRYVAAAYKDPGRIIGVQLSYSFF